MEFEPVVNKVASSDLVVFDLERFWDGAEVVSFDLAPHLFKGLILREKDFRTAIKEVDPAEYAGKHVAVFCSTKAIIPMWAFMLVAARLSPTAASVGFGSPEEVVRAYVSTQLQNHDWSSYKGRNVIVKGCPSDVIPAASYLEAVTSLQRVASKIMYGEACSSVPVWKKPSDVKSSGDAKDAKPAKLGKSVSAKLPRTS